MGTTGPGVRALSDLEERLRALAAAAVLQRVRWGDRSVDVPLGRVFSANPDEVLIRLREGRWLVLAIVGSGLSLNAALRRWDRTTEDGAVLVVIIASEADKNEMLQQVPDRPNRRFSAVFDSGPSALWSHPVPQLVRVLNESAHRRAPPPQALIQKLADRAGESLAEPSSPPPSVSFERIVFALSQAHDLVRLVRGEAQLSLRGGGQLTVLAASGDPLVDDPALAAALARIASGLSTDDGLPGLLVVDGTPDLAERVVQVLGKGSKLGRVNAISSTGNVRPPDAELAQLVQIAQRWTADVDLFTELEAGLSRSGGRRIDRAAAGAGPARLGLIRGLLRAWPSLKLSWLEDRCARLTQDARELRVRFVGPEGGSVEEALGQWRMAAVAARWTGHTVDLLLAGGDRATWDRAKRALGATAPAHVYHLSNDGRLHAKAGVFAMLSAPARAMRKLGKSTSEDQRCSLDELEQDLDRGSIEEFRDAVADAEFATRMTAVAPWATRVMLGLIVVGYAMQIRWDGNDAMETTGAGCVRMGGLTGEGLGWVLSHEPWRLLSAAFLHGSWWHIALNAWALWVLGRRMESILGIERFILLFMGSCIGGSMLHELTSVPGEIAVGSSTGIVGLLAAQGAFALTRRDLLPSRIRKLLLREAWINGLIIGGLSLLPFVGGMAHLGGAIAGFGLVASGLLTVGVSPAEPSSQTPTMPSRPLWLQGLAGTAAALAVISAGLAIIIGQPWVLYSDANRVTDSPFFDGGLTVPVQPQAPRTVRPATGSSPAMVMSGSPLRDGMQVRATAIALDGDGPFDLEEIAAAFGEGPDGALSWTLVEVAGEPAVELLSLSNDAFLHRRWLLIRNGAVVDVEMTALGDVDRALLSGSWIRVPAGADANAIKLPGPRDGRLTDLQAARAGTLGDSEDALLQGVNLAVQGDLDGARRRLDVVLGADADQRARAVRLSQVLRGPASTLLSGRALAHTPNDQRALMSMIHAHNLMLAGDFVEAAEHASAEPLTRASAYWYAGDDAAAAASAAEWRGQSVPGWASVLSTVTGRGYPPELDANLAWASFLEGDPQRCIKGSESTLSARPDLTFAHYNLALCHTAAGDLAQAKTALKAAHKAALDAGDTRLRRNAQMDFKGLARRNTPGAQALLDEFFADLNATP
ncbi:MAG: rhomboid family intramembrane serine protease [Myxococcota bacterium]